MKGQKGSAFRQIMTGLEEMRTHIETGSFSGRTTAPSYQIGDKIIARKLSANANQPNSTNTMPPRVAKIVGKAGTDYLISLRIVAGGENRWNKKPRRCPPEKVARLATEREVAVGMALEALP